MALRLDNNRIQGSVGRNGVNRVGDVSAVQRLINSHLPVPLRPLNVDGRCGPATIAAIEEIQRRSLRLAAPDGRVDPNGATFRFLTGTATYPGPGTIAWGAKVSPTFKAKVISICGNLGIEPDYLMAAMAFESGETFSASAKNKISGATGLIQFMPSTAETYGTTTEDLAGMTAEGQLDYVQKYFSHYRNELSSIEDVYMVILWPKAVGKDNSYVLFSKPSKAYTQNAGLDANHDGHITKEEAAAKVKAKLQKGMGAGYRG